MLVSYQRSLYLDRGLFQNQTLDISAVLLNLQQPIFGIVTQHIDALQDQKSDCSTHLHHDCDPQSA